MFRAFAALGILNSRQATSSLVMLVAEDERWEAPDPLPGVLPENWGGTEPKRTVTCIVLKAKTNNRLHLASCHDEFRRPRSDYV
ncbi:uncharacterized protein TNCV_3750351 [Trichonephila clavipes]|nr:uncharacterized protein TNCV_3750351 [Trichonephila clavipes]